MLNRTDVERIIENTLKELSIRVEPHGQQDGNIRTIELRYKDSVISKTHLDITTKDKV